RRLHAHDSLADPLEAQGRMLQTDRRAARRREANGQAQRVEPAIGRPKTGLNDVRAQICEAVAGLVAAQDLDILDAPRSLRLDPGTLLARGIDGTGAEQVALVADVKIVVVPSDHLVEG